jgi:hypothetical protein
MRLALVKSGRLEAVIVAVALVVVVVAVVAATEIVAEHLLHLLIARPS